ncbi:hypothetical protein B0T22DRAFT_57009 [Podospora appendiculata]|uniref:Nitrogen regulatory protein areA GATA-like domain-containing protein n=1 Tax=Podospora appendiculata TaxID=314037 RepID=A0AAE0XIL5_9PEZI|nr:hypothetical protein B0T22DRAFT_57009 [Podospora appendiculata]
MAQQLPSGLLETTKEIYAEVASYDVVPWQKIRQYWTVYTTTFKMLRDPTSQRLEHFWWHVWGSNRRFLSGPELAKLFEQVSLGPTFVRLRAPVIRIHGPPISPELLRRLEQGQIPERNPSKSNMKSPTPSASRPPPPHPILKKTSEHSTPETRPTARFAEPQPPDEQDDDDEISDDDISDDISDETSDDISDDIADDPRTGVPPAAPSLSPRNQARAASSAATQSVEMPPPPPPALTKRERSTNSTSTAPTSGTGMRPPPIPKALRRDSATGPSTAAAAAPAQVLAQGKGEKGATSTRRIVAATAASRRRPAMPLRRPSSQSSSGEPGATASGTAKQSKGSRQTTQSESSGRRSSNDSVKPSPPTSGTMSAKAAGKRPERPIGPPPSISSMTSTESAGKTPGTPHRLMSGVTAPKGEHSLEGRDAPLDVTHPGGNKRGNTTAPIAGFVTDQELAQVAPRMVRSSSSTETPQRLNIKYVPPRAMIGESLVSMSNTTVQGQFDSEMIIGSSLPKPRDLLDVVALRSTVSDVLVPQLQPTPPNPSPPIPFSRTKSQLLLLLDRNSARKEKKDKGS